MKCIGLLPHWSSPSLGWIHKIEVNRKPSKVSIYKHVQQTICEFCLFGKKMQGKYAKTTTDSILILGAQLPNTNLHRLEAGLTSSFWQWQGPRWRTPPMINDSKFQKKQQQTIWGVGLFFTPDLASTAQHVSIQNLVLIEVQPLKHVS